MLKKCFLFPFFYIPIMNIKKENPNSDHKVPEKYLLAFFFRKYLEAALTVIVVSIIIFCAFSLRREGIFDPLLFPSHSLSLSIISVGRPL